MADLNKELNEYLLSNKNDKRYKLAGIAIPKSPLSRWFGARGDPETDRTDRCQETKREYCPTMTRTQRLTAFALCCFTGILCFCLSAIYVPVLLLKARKFALLYSLGSLFFLTSFGFLWGATSYLESLLSAERRCFALSYLATLFGTLYFALHLQSTPMTVVCAVLQIIAVLWFLVSSIPGGTSGLAFLARIFKSSVGPTLPV